MSADLIRFVQQEFRQLADPEKAVPMAAYMKTDMPFYGIQKKERLTVYRQMRKRFAPASRKQWREGVLALWSLPHREEKYTAIEYAIQGSQFHDKASLPLIKRLIREGAWWDLVDTVATQIVSPMLREQRAEMRPIMDRWIEDRDLWLRRTALLSQLGHKADTDQEQLFSYCLLRAGETEFFIRKAIGWALRDYSWTNPAAVKGFLEEHGEKLSSLSRREASKRLPN